MNTEPPYEITPDDLSVELFERNKRPNFEQLKLGVAAGQIVNLRDPAHFNVEKLTPIKEVDEEALKRGLLSAPNFYFSIDILNLIDRMFDFVMRADEVRESAQRDNPDIDVVNPTPEERKNLRQQLLVAFIAKSMEVANVYTMGFARERMKLGLEPDIYSMVSVMPDLKGFDEPVLSLINLFYITGEGADTHCYIDLMRP